MKTQLSLTRKKKMNVFGFVLALLITTVTYNPVYGQAETNSQNERTVKGVISDANGPLESVNVILKGSNTGIVTNEKGEFTFPKPLKAGDILLVSYLGYKTQEVVIRENTTLIKITLEEDLFEFVGALDTNKPYKSKRSKKKQ